MEETLAQKLARWQELKKRTGTSNNPPANTVVAEEPKKIEREINTSYDEVEHITLGKRMSIKWHDSKLADVPCYEVNQATAGNMISLGQTLLANISENKISTTSVDICLTLAVSLASPSSQRFTHLLAPPSDQQGKKLEFSQPTASAVRSRGLSDMEKRLLDKSKRTLETESDEDKKQALKRTIEKLEAQEKGTLAQGDNPVVKEDEAISYGFLAASLLKLYAKTPETFLEGLSRMKDRFSAWYDTSNNILRNFNPVEQALGSFRVALSRRPEVLSTWTLWVACNENKTPPMLINHQGLMTYLAGQQFSYPGMHAYTLLIEIHEQTGMKFNQLLREMDCPATRSGVREALDLIKTYEVTKLNPNRTTYFRYARNWDPKYFGALQSTQCKTLVYVAASVCKKISTQGENGDPMEIYAIKSLDATLKNKLEAVALRMANKIIDQMLVDAQSGEAWLG